MEQKSENMHTLELNRPHLLIVEGKDEENLFKRLLETMNILDVQVLGIGGKDYLRRYLETVVRHSYFRELRTISIIRDADTDPDATFQSITDALKQYNLPAPEKPLQLKPGKPRVQVMILPDAKRQGALETLCMESVAGDPATSCVKEYIGCLQQKGIELPQNKVDKSRANTFISSKEYPDCKVGEAALRGCWDLESKAFEPVRKFIANVARESQD